MTFSNVFEFAKQAYLPERLPAALIHMNAVLELASRHANGDTEIDCIAVLHDVCEDTAVTVTQLRGRFGNRIADAVDALTRRPGEVYADYIPRCALNRDARLVKSCDLIVNLKRSYLGDDDKSLSLRARYERALILLASE